MNLQAEVLAQILVMQSMLQEMPDKETMLSFLCRGLEDIPGVASVEVADEACEVDTASYTDHTYQLPLRLKKRTYGALTFHLKEPERFKPYTQYLCNLGFMVSVIIEEKSLRERLQQHQKELETLVAQRTSALRESQERYKALIETTSDWIWELNTEGLFTFVSAKVYDILGYTPEELIGTSTFALMPPEEAARVTAIYATYVEKEAPFENIANRNLHKDGHEVILQTNGAPFFSSEGKLRGYRGVDRDITQERMLQDHIRQMDKMNAVGQLAGGVAHDFNNQLAGIMGAADLLSIRLHDPKLKHYANAITQSATRASDLTRQLLDFARKGNLVIAPVDIHAVIAEVVEMLSHTIDRRIEIKQLLKAKPAVVQGDASLLQNMLLNLSLNARDAMPEGGTLRLESDVVDFAPEESERRIFEIEAGHYIRISVTDTGCGMNKATRQHIFEPFYTTKEIGKGTGMGLAAVYGVVQSHRGAIHVYSEPGYGSSFHVYLPIAEADEAHIEEEDRSSPIHLTRSILLIDDEPVFQEIASDMLSEAGHYVKLCPEGAEAVAYYEEHWREIDLIILDMIMPKMHGTETFHRLRAINPQAVVLLASGFSINGDAQRLLQQGVRGFIQKPFKYQQLLHAVEDALSADAKVQLPAKE